MTIMKAVLTAASIAVCSLPVAANAAPLRFSFTGIPTQANSFSFQADSNPVPARTDEFSFDSAISNNNGYQTINSDGSVTFFADLFGGGFDFFSGPQLFTGDTTAPQFLTGSFLLTSSSGTPEGTLVVSALTGAVPEPTTWAMMILGMGAVGFAMRHRNKVAATVRFA